MAQAQEFQPEWTKPQNWPDRRRAPGYPRRWSGPSSVVAAVGLPLALIGFSCDLVSLGCAAVAFLVIAHIIVFRVRLARFYCPECAKRLPLKWPPPGEFVRFHCRDCRIIWLTGIEVREDSGS